MRSAANILTYPMRYGINCKLISKINYLRFEFQVHGIEWMYNNYTKRLGCILADDMGLGKTVQVSVLIRCLQRTQGLRDTVIIAPHSLLRYWESEYRRWLCPGIFTNIVIVRSKNDTFINDKFRFGSRIQRIIIMTSDAFDNFYHMLERNLRVDLLVIDEGHKAKNVDTKLRKAIKAFNAG